MLISKAVQWKFQYDFCYYDIKCINYASISADIFLHIHTHVWRFLRVK